MDNRRDLLLAHTFGAGDGIRTRDINLGKVALYQLSYSRLRKTERLRFRLWFMEKTGESCLRLWPMRCYSTFSDEIVAKSIHLLVTIRLSTVPRQHPSPKHSLRHRIVARYVYRNKKLNQFRYFCFKNYLLC